MSKSKLTEEQVKSIPDMLKQMNQRKLAEQWGVTLGAISYWTKKYRDQGVELNKWNRGIIIKNNEKENAQQEEAI